MKSYLVKLFATCCVCIALCACASIPQSVYVHDHRDELWGISKAELLKAVPQEYLTYANIGASRIVLKSMQNASYGNVVMVPVLNETVSYYFHDSRLYRISIESSTNEYSDAKLKAKMYQDFLALSERYRKLCGEPDAKTEQTTPLKDESGRTLLCGQEGYEWKANPGRAMLPLITVRLGYGCAKQPIVIMRVEETYIHTGFAPEQ